MLDNKNYINYTLPIYYTITVSHLCIIVMESMGIRVHTVLEYGDQFGCLDS